MFRHYAVSNPGELLRLLNQGDIRSAVADAAKEVFVLYEQGSTAASALLEGCAEEIARSVRAAILRDGGSKEYPLILSGGLVRKESPLYAMLEVKLLQPGSGISKITVPGVHPAVASAALALHEAGLHDAVEELLEKAKGWQV